MQLCIYIFKIRLLFDATMPCGGRWVGGRGSGAAGGAAGEGARGGGGEGGLRGRGGRCGGGGRGIAGRGRASRDADAAMQRNDGRDVCGYVYG